MLEQRSPVEMKDYKATVILRRWGDSYGIVIPRAIVKELDAEAGECLAITVKKV